jgi:hypothetical protein
MRRIWDFSAAPRSPRQHQPCPSLMTATLDSQLRTRTHDSVLTHWPRYRRAATPPAAAGPVPPSVRQSLNELRGIQVTSRPAWAKKWRKMRGWRPRR